jgi:thioredoxin reductase
MLKSPHPVVIIGAGPVGLAAAAHLVERQEPFLVLEAGATAGASILEWAHVRVFSPWTYNIDPASARLLAAEGWTPPPGEHFPTGAELVQRYLSPLAAHAAIRPHVRYGTRVTGVGRAGMDRMKTPGRERAPFAVRVETAASKLETADGPTEIFARAVIDASGTYRTPNPLGAGGYPAAGEISLSDRIVYGIPDVLGRDRARYQGRRVAVAGSGHSAMNVLLDLLELAGEAPGGRVIWIVRRKNLARVYGGERTDQLPERGRLGARLHEAVDSGLVEVVTGFDIASLRRDAAGIVIASTGAGVGAGANANRTLDAVDEVVAATGFRPDRAMTSEVRLDLDPIVESPRALAPLIDPNVHSCGTVPPHGARELSHPEPDFYTVGMKSYGRAPTFLLRTGYEQVRSVVCALVGDEEGARRVELTLPETGVCSTDRVLALTPSDACCTPLPASAGESRCCGST